MYPPFQKTVLIKLIYFTLSHKGWQRKKNGQLTNLRRRPEKINHEIFQ
jgi:hypothetical protein